MDFPYEFQYTLSPEEVYEASMEAGIFKTTGKRRWVYTALLGIVIVVNLLTYFLKERSGSFLMLAVLSAVVLFAVWYLPQSELHSKAEKNATKYPVPAKVFEDRIEISEDELKWEIPFDSTFSFKDSEKYLIVFSKAGRVAAFPKKDIDEQVLPLLTEFFESKSIN